MSSEGEQCLKCDVCPGLDLHFWRKLCKNCKCLSTDHRPPRAQISELQDALNKLRAKKIVTKELARRLGKSEYTFVPTGIDDVVQNYMDSLPPEKRPLKDTKGEEFRRHEFARQLPKHDLAPQDSSTHGKTPAVLKEIEAYLKQRQTCLGQGECKNATDLAKEVPVPGPKHHGERGPSRVTRKLMPVCERCKRKLDENSTCIVAEQHAKGKVWHPNCFVCETCEELLIDLTYFAHERKLFCGRHHAELLKPRCHGCDELIFSAEYTRAQNADWHAAHFCCFGCDIQLIGSEFVTVNNHPHCNKCYKIMFSLRCHTCHQDIPPGTAHFSHSGHYYHANNRCFSCFRCKTSLQGKSFLDKLNEIFCGRVCYREERDGRQGK